MKSVYALGVVLLAACASTPDYVPEESGVATLGGRTAALYRIPSEANVLASVRIASFGFVDAETKNGNGKKVRALHLRFDVSADGDQPVLVHTSRQVVEGPDGSKHLPGYVTTNAGEPPDLVVPPRSSRRIDFFYDVQPEVAEKRDPKSFRLFWTVELGGQEYAQSTPFHEVAVDPAIAQQEAAQQLPYYWAAPYYGPWYGWGPWYYWW